LILQDIGAKIAAVVTRAGQATLFKELKNVARAYHRDNHTEMDGLLATAMFVEVTFENTELEHHMEGQNVLSAVRYACTRRRSIVRDLKIACAFTGTRSAHPGERMR
jgi:hypothetical protein